MESNKHKLPAHLNLNKQLKKQASASVNSPILNSILTISVFSFKFAFFPILITFLLLYVHNMPVVQVETILNDDDLILQPAIVEFVPKSTERAFFLADCDPNFNRVYSKKLGFDLRCGISRVLVKESSKWLGKPHTSVAGENGIDCSGFVKSVYKVVYGKELTPNSLLMYTKDTRPIKRSELKQGDLVFFNIYGNTISHVGIYLQQDRFIHTSLSKGVTVSSLHDKYYASRYSGAGRVN